jgi:DNA repair protein RadC
MPNSSDGAVEYRTRIMDMPATSRPRERLLEVGADKLSNEQLLAILLRTGSDKESALELATSLIAKFGGLAGLATATIPQLREVRGLGVAKAAEIHAALRLGIRAAAAQPNERQVVKRPEDIVALSTDMSLLGQEQLRVYRLNTRNHIIGQKDVYNGSVNSAQVRVGELFREAIHENASGIVLVHNHPSGDPTPSPDDIRMTEQAIRAGENLEIEVLDHIVVAQGQHVSMKERRLAFA